MKTLTILGANGFVGRRLCDAAISAGHRVRAVARRDWETSPGVRKFIHADLGDTEDLFGDSDWAVNCVGRAHVLAKEDPQASMKAFRSINHDLAIELAAQARMAGVSRYVHISSVAAVRSTTGPGEVIDDETDPEPDRTYGVSKLEADEALIAEDQEEMTIACLRPPALLGPKPIGFIRKFARAAAHGVPLPIGGVQNARSFMAVHNLADATLIALSHGVRGAYIVTDSSPMSIGTLYRDMLRGAGYGDRALRVPQKFLEIAAAAALGARKDSLLGNAAYDGSRFAAETGWRPPMSINRAVDEMMATI
ncbi:NAD-dependent epimerase/dehydratase family protein [Aurantiacibacter aquimixticola]|uniref:NAD-dependent epimerase/dehydratase family protein n=1 Tax=Aurantiacibacter aquimixticola TaxID=1958945 RepID=UPI001403B268|nr:NAD-dependent epimerase/dehydratase family protein [Aurantiacibacter aquimixticola]